MAETLIIERPKSKTLWSLLASAVVGCIGVWMIIGQFDDSSRYSPAFIHLIGWCAALFFGLLAIKMLIGLAKPTQVILTATGFRVKEILDKPPISWSDIDRFFIAQISRQKWVCYELKSDGKTALENAWASHQPAWRDGYLPAYLELEPDELLNVLEDWRQRHSS